MAQVKICGITNIEDALCAAGCGADALGFIFYPQSPRHVTPENACRIAKALPESMVRVGVFVNQSAAEVRRIAGYCELDFIQLHGDESVEYCRDFPPEMIIKAIHPCGESDLAYALNYNVAAILVDSRQAGLYGGTGKKANWDLAIQIRSEKPLILAGGLNEENIKEAIDQVLPQALDINSGVEIMPGKKDHKKLAGIFNIIRNVANMQNERELIFKKRER